MNNQKDPYELISWQPAQFPGFRDDLGCQSPAHGAPPWRHEFPYHPSRDESGPLLRDPYSLERPLSAPKLPPIFPVADDRQRQTEKQK